MAAMDILNYKKGDGQKRTDNSHANETCLRQLLRGINADNTTGTTFSSSRIARTDEHHWTEAASEDQQAQRLMSNLLP
jgi:hypothetical protein